MIRPLIEHLRKEITVYKELVENLQRETENLVQRDYKTLYDTISSKERLIMRMDAMGEVRKRLLSEAALLLGISGEANLSRVIERIGGDDRVDLKECQKAVLSLIDVIKEINRVNSLIVRGSLDNIRKTLGLLGRFAVKGVYTPEGSIEGLKVKGHRLSEGA